MPVAEQVEREDAAARGGEPVEAAPVGGDAVEADDRAALAVLVGVQRADAFGVTTSPRPEAESSAFTSVLGFVSHGR
jgi:hypothetical protein